MPRYFVRPLFLLILIVASAIQARPAGAQAVRGVVVDDQNLAKVGTATVLAVKDDAPGQGTETDAQGRFFLPLPGAGEYRLEVRRIGYETTRSQAFRVEVGDTVSVEFRVAPDAVLVDPITVTAHSLRGRNLFERHRDEWGKGVLFDPQQIDSMHLHAPAEVFRDVDHVKLTWGWGALDASGVRGPLPSVVSQEGTGCLLYMLNRVWIYPDAGAGDQSSPSSPSRHLSSSASKMSATQPEWTNYQLENLLPQDIAAVEVYRSVDEVPPELRRFTNRFPLSNCGLVVFWTKSAW